MIGLKSESPVRTMNGKKHLVLWMKYLDNYKTKRITEMIIRRILKAFQNDDLTFFQCEQYIVAGPSQTEFSFSLDIDYSTTPVMLIQIYHAVS